MEKKSSKWKEDRKLYEIKMFFFFFFVKKEKLFRQLG